MPKTVFIILEAKFVELKIVALFAQSGNVLLIHHYKNLETHIICILLNFIENIIFSSYISYGWLIQNCNSLRPIGSAKHFAQSGSKNPRKYIISRTYFFKLRYEENLTRPSKMGYSFEFSIH